MRIAIAAENDLGLDGTVSHHFGRCPYYVFVDVDEGEAGAQVQEVQVLSNPYYAQHTPGQVPAFIREQGADVMVSGGMGGRAIALFRQYGIRTHTGAAGPVRGALEQVLGGELAEAEPCVGHGHEHDCEHDGAEPATGA